MKYIGIIQFTDDTIPTKVAWFESPEEADEWLVEQVKLYASIGAYGRYTIAQCMRTIEG